MKRCQVMARIIALVYNWWSLYVRLATPERHAEAITSRPLLLYGVGQQTRHGGKLRSPSRPCMPKPPSLNES